MVAVKGLGGLQGLALLFEFVLGLRDQGCRVNVQGLKEPILLLWGLAAEQLCKHEDVSPVLL